MPMLTALLHSVYALHVAAGVLSLPAGYLALAAAKSGTLHRRGGMLFVCAMLTTSALGAVLTFVRHKTPEVNVPAALMSAYLVLTALMAVRPIAGWTRRCDVAVLLVVLAVALCDIAFGVAALTAGGSWHGVPAFPFFAFGVVGLIAVNGDVRILRTGAPRGSRRIARHLWRMSAALIFASLSLGQVKVLPAQLRSGVALAIPPLTVLVVMLWWLWRVRGRSWSVSRAGGVLGGEVISRST